MSTFGYIFTDCVIAMNVFTFFLYGYDKRCAKKNKWRISEKTLIFCAAFMGSVGAFLAMKVFRHKTQHKKFVVGVPILFLFNTAVVVLLAINGLL